MLITTDTPIRRLTWGGTAFDEILDHSEGAMREERAQRGLPLLMHHNRYSADAHVGVVEDVQRVRRGKRWGYAGMARFSQSERGQEIRQDVLDGIRKDISGGYRVWKFTREVNEADGKPDVYRATDWELVECSLEPVPADIAAGVNRSADDGTPDWYEATRHQALVQMPEAMEERKDPGESDGPGTEEGSEERGAGEAGRAEKAARPADHTREETMDKETPEVTSVQAREEAAAGARQEAASIVALAHQHNIPNEKVRKWLDEGISLDKARQNVLDEIRAGRAPSASTPSEVVDLTEKEKKTYSLARLLDSMMDGSSEEAGFEREISREIATKRGKAAQGAYVPNSALTLRTPRASLPGGSVLGFSPQQRQAMAFVAQMQRAMMAQLGVNQDGVRAALDTATQNAAKELVFTEPGSFIELLRNRAMVMQLGATLLPGLRGDLAFPRQTGAATAFWVGENPGSDVTESEITTDLVTLTPKTLQATTATTRQLLRQAVEVVVLEDLLRSDLQMVHALAIDLAAIAADGQSNDPTGIINQTGVGIHALGTDGDAPDWGDFVQLETLIAQGNGDIGTQAILTTPGVRGFAKTTEKATNTARFIQEGGEINGYPVAVTNQVPSDLDKGSTTGACHAAIQGVWEHLYIGEWGALDIIVDPFAKKKQGIVELTSFQMVDVAVRYPAAFAAMVDIVLP